MLSLLALVIIAAGKSRLDIAIPFEDFKAEYGEDLYVHAVPVRQLLDFQTDTDKFKWTFVWNGKNYIFKSLERI